MPELKDFRLGNILEIRSAKAINPAKDKIVRNGKYRFITRTAQNNGVTDYIDFDEQYLSPANTISFGVDTVSFFYQDKPYYTGIKVKVLYPRGFELTENIALYLLVGLRKAVTGFGWGTIYKSMNLDNKLLCLPVRTENGIPIIDTDCKYHKDGYIPDFEYMERYIAELEQERIAELEQYLIATGLNDYTLTDEDKAVLSLFEPSRGNEDRDNAVVGTVPKQDYREFRLIDLFDKKTIRGCPKSEENLTENKNGYYMYGQNICRQYDFKILLDEKYLQKVEELHPILAYTSSVGEIGMITESFYRSGNNGAFQGLFPKHRLYSRYELQYILAILKKYFNNFGYATSMANIKDLRFYLPITQDKDSDCKYHKDGYIPDFAFMERYIKAMEKVVIADVVKYKDGVIAQTKALVNK